MGAAGAVAVEVGVVAGAVSLAGRAADSAGRTALTIRAASTDVAIGVMSNPSAVAAGGAIVTDVVAGYFDPGPPPMTRAGAAAFLTSQTVTLLDSSMPTPGSDNNNASIATNEVPDPPNKVVEPR